MDLRLVVLYVSLLETLSRRDRNLMIVFAVALAIGARHMKLNYLKEFTLSSYLCIITKM